MKVCHSSPVEIPSPKSGTRRRHYNLTPTKISSNFKSDLLETDVNEMEDVLDSYLKMVNELEWENDDDYQLAQQAIINFYTTHIDNLTKN